MLSKTNVDSEKRAISSEAGNDATFAETKTTVGKFSDSWEVRKEHMQERVLEIYEQLGDECKISTVDVEGLLTLYEKVDISNEALKLGINYSGSQAFHDKNSLRNPLQQVVNYCKNEHDGRNPHIPGKLKYIVHMLSSDPILETDAAPGALVTLAMHGGMCHQQKEVGIDLVYSLLTGSAAAEYSRKGLKQCILRLLASLRVNLVEQLYVEIRPGEINTHPLARFRNDMAERLGIQQLADVGYLQNRWSAPDVTEEHYRRFHELYNVEEIYKVVQIAMNETPKKIEYQVLFEWMKENSPTQNPMAFLMHAFDMEDTGNLHREAILWILKMCGILNGPNPPEEWLEPEVGETKGLASTTITNPGFCGW